MYTQKDLINLYFKEHDNVKPYEVVDLNSFILVSMVDKNTKIVKDSVFDVPIAGISKSTGHVFTYYNGDLIQADPYKSALTVASSTEIKKFHMELEDIDYDFEFKKV